MLTVLYSRRLDSSVDNVVFTRETESYKVRKNKRAKDRREPQKRDPYARELEKTIYRQRRLNSAKKYNRKMQKEDI